MSKTTRLHYLSLSANQDKCVPIYDSSAGNRKVPLLKTLVSNHRTNNCAYCAFRSNRRTKRRKFEPPELADIALKLWKRFYRRSIFEFKRRLKSQQSHQKRNKNSQYSSKKGYTGYLHLRLMPSCDKYWIKQAAELSDRIGLNLENPDKEEPSKIRPEIDQDIEFSLGGPRRVLEGSFHQAEDGRGVQI